MLSAAERIVASEKVECMIQMEAIFLTDVLDCILLSEGKIGNHNQNSYDVLQELRKHELL